MKIIAHRGASASAPENTMAAFQLAWQMNADGIEFDVQLSRDGEIMVHHDADTRRSAGVDLKVTDNDSHILRELDVGSRCGEQFRNTRIPVLHEVLAQVPFGKQVLIEIKCGSEIIPVLSKTLAQTDTKHFQIALISFDLDVLINCRNAFPQLPCYPVFSYQYENSCSNITNPVDWIELARQHQFAGLDPDYRDITPEFANAIKAAGLELVTWTVNKPENLTQLQAIGVDIITTDCPDVMQAALNGKEF